MPFITGTPGWWEDSTEPSHRLSILMSSSMGGCDLNHCSNRSMTILMASSMGRCWGRSNFLGHRIESQLCSPGRHLGILERRAVIPTSSGDGEEKVWLALPPLLKETQYKEK